MAQDEEEYVTTINPYLYDINGVIKIAAIVDTAPAKEFINCFIKKALINKVFKTDNKLLQALYDTLTDIFFIKSFTELEKKEKENLNNKIKELTNDVSYYREELNRIRNIFYL